MPIPTESSTSPATTEPSATEGASSTLAADPVQIRSPRPGEGGDMWRLARDGGELDLNSSYAYLVLAADFATTCRVAVSAGEVVGFLLGYQPPQRPGSVFVWQVAVRADQRGRRLAARMLDDLVDALPGVHTLEATVTEDNTASRRLFASFARGRGAELTWSEGVPATDFPDGHDGEPRLHISPLTRS